MDLLNFFQFFAIGSNRFFQDRDLYINWKIIECTGMIVINLFRHFLKHTSFWGWFSADPLPLKTSRCSFQCHQETFRSPIRVGNFYLKKVREQDVSWWPFHGKLENGSNLWLENILDFKNTKFAKNRRFSRVLKIFFALWCHFNISSLMLQINL